MQQLSAVLDGLAKPEPTEPVCEFCGQPLQPEVIRLPGSEPFVGGHRPCNCPQAVDARRQEQKRLLAEEERERRAVYTRAGIPDRYVQAGCDSAASMADEVQRDRCGLLLTGPNGTGKTHTACSVLRILIDRGTRCRFVSTATFLNEVKATFGQRSPDDIVQRYAQVPVLVLDDLGKEQPTAWVLAQLFALIDERYAQVRPTIVTTNYTLDQLVARFTVNGDRSTGQSIVSRISEGTRGHQFRLDGLDLRK